MQLWIPHLRVLCAQQMRKPSSIEAVESLFKIHIEPFIGSADQRDHQRHHRPDRAVAEGGYPGPNGKSVKATAGPKTLNNRKTIVTTVL